MADLRLGSPAPRWRSRHLSRARLALAIVVGVLALASVVSTQRRAERTLAAYGHLARVAVALRDLQPGQQLATGDVEWRRLPAVAVPRAAATGTLAGRTLVAPVAAGQVVTANQVTPGHRLGLAALVPPGREAVAVPVKDAHLAVRVGDLVDVWAPDDAGAQMIATGAVVVATTDAEVTIAVSRVEAERLAAALGVGVPVLALVGPR